MRKVLVVVLTTFSLILGFAALTGTADAAAKPAYKVTLKASTTSSVAGKFIVVAGKVTGPKAAGRTVTIQRKYADGGWVNVAFATIKPSGRFSARVETPRGGDTSFRALKGKSSVRKAGISPVRSTKVFEWLYLTRQPAFVSNTSPFQEPIGGKLYPHSYTFFQNGSLVYKTNGLCTKFTTVASYGTTTQPPVSDALTFDVRKTPLNGADTTLTTPVATGQQLTVSTSLVGTKYLDLEISSHAGNNYKAVLGDPKVYCNAPALPEFLSSDV